MQNGVDGPQLPAEFARTIGKTPFLLFILFLFNKISLCAKPVGKTALEGFMAEEKNKKSIASL